jgi:hypothetical protein
MTVVPDCMLLAFSAADAARAPPTLADSRELVVLVHGMGRTRLSMFAMGARWSARVPRGQLGLQQHAWSVPGWGCAWPARCSGSRAQRPRCTSSRTRWEHRRALGRWPTIRAAARGTGGDAGARPTRAPAPPTATRRGWGGSCRRSASCARASDATARTLAASRRARGGGDRGGSDGKVSVAESHWRARDHAVWPRIHHTFIMNGATCRGCAGVPERGSLRERCGFALKRGFTRRHNRANARTSRRGSRVFSVPWDGRQRAFFLSNETVSEPRTP